MTCKESHWLGAAPNLLLAQPAAAPGLVSPSHVICRLQIEGCSESVARSKKPRNCSIFRNHSIHGLSRMQTRTQTNIVMCKPHTHTPPPSQLGGPLWMKLRKRRSEQHSMARRGKRSCRITWGTYLLTVPPGWRTLSCSALNLFCSPGWTQVLFLSSPLLMVSAPETKGHCSHLGPVMLEGPLPTNFSWVALLLIPPGILKVKSQRLLLLCHGIHCWAPCPHSS